MYQQQQAQPSYGGGLIMPNGRPQTMQQGPPQQQMQQQMGHYTTQRDLQSRGQIDNMAGGMPPPNPTSMQNFVTDMQYRPQREGGPATENAYQRFQQFGQPQRTGNPNEGTVDRSDNGMNYMFGGSQQQISGVPQMSQAPQSYSVNQFQQWAQQRYGRQASDSELNQIAQHVGYQGGDISQDQWNRAQNFSDQMARQQGWQAPQEGGQQGGGQQPQQPPQRQPTQPTYQQAPQQQQQQQQPQQPQNPQQPQSTWYNQNDITNFQNWAQQRYGRQATPEELERIASNSTDMGSAQSYADTMARNAGWQGGQQQGQGGQQQQQQQAAPWYNQNDITTFQNWARARYGREATPEELARIGQNSTSMQTAQDYADTMARQMGWQGPANTGTTNPAPWGQNQGTIDPVTGRMFGPQYQNPYQQQQQQLMQAILGSGGSMNQQVQDQMFEQQKEQALALNKQLGLQGQQNTAARGFGSGGAAAASVQNNLNSILAKQLMGGRRDISAQAAQVNRQDQLNALQASQGLDQQAYGQFMGDRNASLQEWLAQRQNQLDNRRTTNQEEQFRRSLELEYQRFVESQRQFNQNFGENQRQYNGQMGFNYSNMNNNNNNSFLRYLMGS